MVLWTSKGISQNLNDSVTCIPNIQLRKAINLIENGKVVKQELELANEKAVVLENRLCLKDSIISQYVQNEKSWKKIDSNYKIQIYHYEDYKKNTQRIFEEQRSQIRGLKLKKWLGIFLGIGVGYLIHK